MRRLAFATSLAALALMAGFAPSAQAGMVLPDEASATLELPEGQNMRKLRIRTERTVTTIDANFDKEIEAFPVMRPEDDSDAFEVADDLASEMPEEIERFETPEEDDDADEPALMSRGDIRTSLNEQGFSEIDGLRRRGRVYIAEVTGPEGDRMRVVINAETGDIAGLRVLERVDEDRRAELDFLDK